MNPADAKKALVVSYSQIATDPRVSRQAAWLKQSGYEVDTLGLGESGGTEANRHFALIGPKSWVVGPVGALITGTFLPRKWAFEVTLGNRIPHEARQRIASGYYSLLVLNENEFLPLLSAREMAGERTAHMRVHLDLHEKHRPDRRRDTLGGWLTSGYYRWVYRHTAHARIDSRTVVNEPIGALYAQELDIPMPAAVRNIPPYRDLEPSPVDPDRIKLLFHGMASHQRGFEEILEAMETLPSNFTMTFMIMPNPAIHLWLERQIEKHPARERLEIVPPAPMEKIPEWINAYDLEIIYYPHLEDNLALALPNKFFESIQGRLGLLVAEGETMAPEVREWHNGVVVPGHDGAKLRSALAALTAPQIEEFKAASNEVAPLVNAESEGQKFLDAVG